jgi:hypothetical protein
VTQVHPPPRLRLRLRINSSARLRFGDRAIPLGKWSSKWGRACPVGTVPPNSDGKTSRAVGSGVDRSINHWLYRRNRRASPGRSRRAIGSAGNASWRIIARASRQGRIISNQSCLRTKLGQIVSLVFPAPNFSRSVMVLFARPRRPPLPAVADLAEDSAVAEPAEPEREGRE